jgi:formylglycine-generating enzyme required for sulfatase activity
MSIEVTTNNQPIQVSTSGQTVSATVAGGQGPQGPPGESGAADWDDIANVPAAFPPQAHAATHGEDGADPLTLSTSQVDGLEDALDGKLPLAGGAMEASAIITLSDATSDSEVAGWGFGVQVTEDVSQYAYMEAGGFYVHGNGSSTTITPAGVTLHNATQLVKGSFDNNTGGANGISMICAVGYELNWQGGRLRNVQISGNGTPQPIYSDSSIIFSGEGGNVEIGSGGLTFSDSSTQTVAWPGTLSYDDLDDLPTLFDGSYASLTNVPSTFTPTSHSHAVSDIAGLQTAIDAKYPQDNTAAYGAIRGPLMVGTTGRPSYYGTFDQHGNVEEWIGTFGGASRNDTSKAMMRGGSYLSESAGGTYPITYVWDSIGVGQAVRFENVGFRVATIDDPNGYGGFVTVGDSGNTANASGVGDVAYSYRLGRYTVTNTDYAAFLNAVAATDTNALYDTRMGSESVGGISRSGSPGSYTYAVRANMGQKPANYMNWYSAARYCNWMHNGKPSGSQTSSTTEGGAYAITSSTTLVAANAGAKYRLPTESEWVKAGRYKGGSTNAGYWTFATQSNTYPDKIATDLLGSGLPLVATSGSASDLTTGTLPDARLSATVTAALTNSRTPTAHKSSHATGGADALAAADIGAASASHAHAASDITSGTIAAARLGSGTADSSSYLRGDQTWAAVASVDANTIFHPFLFGGM